MVAGHHAVMLGPPGTAKSLAARLVCEGISGARFFGRLLTRFSTPEEVFGPLDLGALEDGRYERLVDGYLPTANVAFLDEIFKASSAILNALLTVLNERRFENGRQVLEVPLVAMVGASNEIPDEAALAALYDRFVVRLWVEPIRGDDAFVTMLRAAAPEGMPACVSLDDLATLRAAARAVAVGDDVLGDIVRLRRALERAGVVVSDRRWRGALDFLKARALLRGADAVDEAALGEIEACLWSDPEEIEEVRRILGEVLSGDAEDAERLVEQAGEVIRFAQRAWDSPKEEARALVEAHAKLTRLIGEADTLVARSARRGRPSERVTGAREELGRLLAALVAESF
jgi:MoxR-like ATPase